jgi:hypothetical protein
MRNECVGTLGMPLKLWLTIQPEQNSCSKPKTTPTRTLPSYDYGYGYGYGYGHRDAESNVETVQPVAQLLAIPLCRFDGTTLFPAHFLRSSQVLLKFVPTQYLAS